MFLSKRGYTIRPGFINKPVELSDTQSVLPINVDTSNEVGIKFYKDLGLPLGEVKEAKGTGESSKVSDVSDTQSAQSTPTKEPKKAEGTLAETEAKQELAAKAVDTLLGITDSK